MSAHTPGLWHVDAHNNVMAAGGLVAFPGISAGFDQKANARLIAAAPELLEACKRLLVCMNLANWENDDSAIFARAALAKAGASHV